MTRKSNSERNFKQGLEFLHRTWSSKIRRPLKVMSLLRKLNQVGKSPDFASKVSSETLPNKS